MLVASTDGVGTKLKVAFLTDRHDTIGQDIVNHCVNDILTTGATPLFFLDYFATGKLHGDQFEQVIKGVAQACRENDCALIGGETAEMPGFYQAGDYELSGTIVGVADRADLIPGRDVAKGDLMVGLPSTGLHTNGYSLARAALLKKWSVDSFLDELGETVGAALLAIHRSYLNVTRPVLKQPWLHGLAHITGGGLEGNIDRLLDEDQSAAIDWDTWEWPAIFRLIQDTGYVPIEDMRRTFNLGIGWVIIVDPTSLTELETHLQNNDEEYTVIGEVR